MRREKTNYAEMGKKIIWRPIPIKKVDLLEIFINAIILGQYPVNIKSLRGTLYWPDKKPACYNGRATVLMPGVVHLYEGRKNYN
jgi:hypothetical protein